MEQVRNGLLVASALVLAVLILAVLVRAILGPRFTDRIIAVNVINTLVVALLVVLSVWMSEDFLVDVALIYALLSFLTVVVVSRLVLTRRQRHKEDQGAGAPGKKEAARVVHNIVTGLGLAVLLFGLFVFFTAVLGLYRFDYVLNRMHAAAVGDALGIFCILLGLMLLHGWSLPAFKTLAILLFLWLTSPVSSHLIAEMEVLTIPDIQKECEVEVR